MLHIMHGQMASYFKTERDYGYEMKIEQKDEYLMCCKILSLVPFFNGNKKWETRVYIKRKLAQPDFSYLKDHRICTHYVYVYELV